MENIFTVTELTSGIKILLESSFDVLWVEGEISNLRRPASGHSYFTLKDENSQIRAVIFRQSSRMISFDLEDGMSIICRARLSVYQPRGEYQLIVDTVEPKGVGALQLAFEQLKVRLEKEGLFDPSRKKPIPSLPGRIGIITSPTGAAVRDILNITGRRFPSVDILIAPVRVQGAEAPPEITQAIADLNTIPGIDVIILTRGGGSLEDLAPFNDERVARGIYDSGIPVISAVGHEIDFTIADFAADLRAPTPSAAAELVVPIRSELIESLENLRLRMTGSNRRMRSMLKEKAILLRERLKDPRRKIADMRINLDDTTTRLIAATAYGLDTRKNVLHNLGANLMHANPAANIREYMLLLENLEKNMLAGCRYFLNNLKNRVEGNMTMLDMLSPLSVLKRGYSIVRKLPEGDIIRKSSSVTVGSDVSVKVSSGSFNAKVTQILPE
ncbi:MAG: exodeoxyribonuclease VII large subunit [Proteobacteria bacterium]|nr:exodeoxyribonuclease VII large subunit [Pseudomonadota bacterium]